MRHVQQKSAYDYFRSSLPSKKPTLLSFQLVLGINKYSHDTTLCAADASSGKVLFAMAKERLTRKKHDAGNVAILVDKCLESLELDYENIEKVVMNNHHHRILPVEADPMHMQWEAGLRINGGVEDGYDDDENLFPDIDDKIELSHHLAHAYSTATQSPFDSGLVVVMDGMGETIRTMYRAYCTNDDSYVSDFSFGEESFSCVPKDVIEKAKTSYFDWREAESVYTFQKLDNGIEIKPVFKRFTPENSPPSLYNHGFENMDSLGALYSRASSHIFGDWNACGKVMGLAPWIVHDWEDGKDSLAAAKHDTPIMKGMIQNDELELDRHLIKGTPLVAQIDPTELTVDGEVSKGRYDFDALGGSQDGNTGYSNESHMPSRLALEAISLADRIQIDLETVAMDFVAHFKNQVGAENLCISGGVGLNSVLNGRLCRELGFRQTFVSPYPGDDGIAVGCCAYGLYGNSILDGKKEDSKVGNRPPMWKSPLSPYLGPDPTPYEIEEAISNASPWIEVERIVDEDERVALVAEEIASGGVVAWYNGRSELGPRALGHRSILADPRKEGMVRFINQKVKSRESFRPFAPSALVEHAEEWFELGDDLVDPNVSPYMSMTANVREDKRVLIPAVTHVDGSSRLQTVTPQAEPLYHKLISKFHEITGVPLVLNTSFNTLPKEPIVETPRDAIKSFMYSMGSLEMLVMGDFVITRKKADLQQLLGSMPGEAKVKIPAKPKRAGPATFQTSFDLKAGKAMEDEVITTTRVKMPARLTHTEKNGWFDLLDELEGELLCACDGTVTLNDLLSEYTAMDADSKMDPARVEESERLLQNILHRLVRLYEHTLISW